MGRGRFGASKLPFDPEYFENGKNSFTCQLDFNISSTEVF